MHYLEDRNISLKAFAILVKALNIDEKGVVTFQELKDVIKTEGEKSIRAGVKELKDKGYCIFYQFKKSNSFSQGCYLFSKSSLSEESYLKMQEPVEEYFQNRHAQNRHAQNRHAQNRHAQNRQPSQNAQNAGSAIVKKTQIAVNEEYKENRERKTLFCNSSVYRLAKDIDSENPDYSDYFALFKGVAYKDIDLVYYFHAVNDWSNSSYTKRTANGWISTVRQFIRRDGEKKTVKYIQGSESAKSSESGTKSYFDGYLTEEDKIKFLNDELF